MTMGKTVIGSLAETIAQHLDEIHVAMAGLDGEAAIAAVQAWLEERQFNMYVFGPMKCLMQLTPMHAFCHQLAGTASWRQRKPNYFTRSDEHCSHCKCAIVDDEHGSYWTRRYIMYRRSWLLETNNAASRQSVAVIEAEHRVTLGRAAYARTMLEKLQLPVPMDEELLS
jgi:hypothetical protein